MNIETKLLPQCVQATLKACGFNKRDISVIPSESVCVRDGSGDGIRAFCITINMATGETRRVDGSWGGSNMFVTRQVDADDTKHQIPINGAVFLGREGGGLPVRGSLYVHPASMPPALPAVPELTDSDKAILKQWVSLTSAGRKNEWERYDLDMKYGNGTSYSARRPTPAELDSLVSRGLLSRNKAGAISITIAGKNAIGR